MERRGSSMCQYYYVEGGRRSRPLEIVWECGSPNQRIRDIISSHFQKLYSSEREYEPLLPCFGLNEWQPLPIEAKVALYKNITYEEVDRAVWDHKPLRAPGLNGLHLVFFQTCWNVVGDSLFDFVKYVFQVRKVPLEANETTNLHETISQFRPISLCNVRYKVITKILVHRLWPFLNQFISLFQSSFILGRRASDNVIILREALNVLKKKQGRKSPSLQENCRIPTDIPNR